MPLVRSKGEGMALEQSNQASANASADFTGQFCKENKIGGCDDAHKEQAC